MKTPSTTNVMHNLNSMFASAKLRPTAQTPCLRSVSSRFFREKAGAQTRTQRPPPRSDTPKFNTNLLSYHWDTIPPTPAQLTHASKFFATHPPKFLWSAEKFKNMEFGNSPEVCFLGRSNVGKSSLLNTLLLRRVAFTSSKPGRTRLMNAFSVGSDENNGENRLVVLDMPGYGKGGRAEWGVQILKYLEKRKQLKRAFLLVDAEHGLKTTDKQLLAVFKEKDIPFQIILSKADKILYDGGNKTKEPGLPALMSRVEELQKVMETIKDEVQPNTEDDGGGTGEVISCSSSKWLGGKRMGIEAVRFAMLRAAGLEFREPVNVEDEQEIVPYDEITWKNPKPKQEEIVPYEEVFWKAG